MESVNTYWSDRALLEWQLELGAIDAICDAPVDRYALDAKPAAPKIATPAKGAPPPVITPETIDAPALATQAAAAAGDLDALAAAMKAFDLCDLKRGARHCVFADGQPAARVMVIGDAPDQQEDRAGMPFVGPEGLLLDRMFAAIGLDRAATEPAGALYLTTALPWRLPNQQPPLAHDVAMMKPFLERHIALANPDILVLMGSTPCQILLGRDGMTRLRGRWNDVLGRPAMPMFHPAHVLRQTAAKRDAWADLLAIKSRLKELS